MACISTALLVGGGIAGLSAAIALSRIGVRCEVVELAETSLGASLGLSGRAAEALDELGVYDECYATGSPWPRNATPAAIMDADGRLISPSPDRPDWPGSKTAIGVYRPVLIQILAQEAEKLGVEIRKGLTATDIQDGDGAALVTFNTGEPRRYDLVVGADGIGSRTRSALFPDAPKPAYAGQMSIRWMAPGPPIEPEGFYVGPVGRVGFYRLPGNLVYVPTVINAPEWVRMTKEEIYALLRRLLDSYTAPAILELKERLTPESDLICRPFEWLLLKEPWYRGRTILIGDAAHATTAHMGMGGGMALEDSVVLARCIAAASALEEAFAAFMTRRLPRVRTVVETSVALSRLEQARAPSSENRALMISALQAISEPY